MHARWQVHMHTIISVDMVDIITVITMTINITTVMNAVPANIIIIISAVIIGLSSLSPSCNKMFLMLL